MFDLIFKHEHFLLINKHTNVSVHKDENTQSLLMEVSTLTKDSQLYLVHRLDKMTSGLLLLARNAKAASELSLLFSERKIAKFYLAVLSKKPIKKQGTISGDMKKSRRGSWKLVATKHNPAITQFFSVAAHDGKRLALCKPHTGKTHQIRVAMKSIGAPILGDERYGGASAKRGYLHAYGLCFEYQNKAYEFFLPPKDGQDWSELPQAWLTPQVLDWPKK